MKSVFTLEVGIATTRLYANGGIYTSTRAVWERCLGLTAAQMLLRFDMAYDGELEQTDVATLRAWFVGLPHAAQAAMVADWTGDDSGWVFTTDPVGLTLVE